MISIAKATKNITIALALASEKNWDDGCKWYTEARQFCKELSVRYDYDILTVVGILAVLSPQCAWETNKAATEDMLEHGYTERQCYPDNIRKAERILEGETFEQVTNHKRYGRKVRAFYDNILNPETSELVTVDTHAIRAAFDTFDLTTRQIRWVFECGGNKILQQAYINVATSQKYAPLKIQAVVWLAVKDKLEVYHG